MPYFDPVSQAAGIDPYGEQDPSSLVPAGYTQNLPALGQAISQKKGLIGPALKSGAYDIAGALGAGVGAVGGALGIDPVRDWGIGVSDAMQKRSQEAGRPDLEMMPWRDEWSQKGKGLTDVPEWAAYQIAKQAPQMGLAMVGGGLAGAGLKAAGLAAPGAEFAAGLPTWMGGGGLKAGMSALEQDAARAAGADLAQQVMGTTVAGIPQAAGSMYQEEVDRSRQPGQPGLSQGSAMASLGLAPVYSALDAGTPSQTFGMIKRGLAGNLGKRLATAALSEGAQEMVQEGLQTGMEMSFRPDMSMADKAQNIVDSALVGGLVGGAFGSLGGIHRLKSTPPEQISNEAMASTADAELSGRTADQQADADQNLMPSQPRNNKEIAEFLGKDLKWSAADITTLNGLFENLNANGVKGFSKTNVEKLKALGVLNAEKKIAETPDEIVANLQARLDATRTDSDRADVQERLDAAMQMKAKREEAGWENPAPYAPTPTQRAPRRGEVPPPTEADMAGPGEGEVFFGEEEGVPPPPPGFAPGVTGGDIEAPTGTGNRDVDYLAGLPRTELGKLQREAKAAGPNGIDIGEWLNIAHSPGEGFFYQTPDATSNAFDNLQDLVADLVANHAANLPAEEEAVSHETAAPGGETTAPATAPDLREQFLSSIPENRREPISQLVGQLEKAVTEKVGTPEYPGLTPEVAATEARNFAERQGLQHIAEPLVQHISTLATEAAAARTAEQQAKTAKAVAEAPTAAANEAIGQQKRAVSDQVKGYFKVGANTVKFEVPGSQANEQIAFQPQSKQVTFTRVEGRRKVKSVAIGEKTDLAQARKEGMPLHLAEAIRQYTTAGTLAERTAAKQRLVDDWMDWAQQKEDANAVQVGGSTAANVVANAQTRGPVGEGNTAGQIAAASGATQKARAPLTDEQKALKASERKSAKEQERQDAIGEVYTKGRWDQVKDLLNKNVAYEDIAKKVGLPLKTVMHAIRWINKPGDTREWLGYGRRAAEKGWVDPKTKDIALRFLDGDISPADAIAEAKEVLNDEKGYAERVQLVANLVKSATNQMKSRDTKSEDTEDLAKQYNPLTEKHQKQFDRLGFAAQQAMDRMVRSGKNAGQIYDLIQKDFPVVAYHASPGLINDYAQSIGEKLPPTPIPQTESTMRRGDPVKLAQETEKVLRKLQFGTKSRKLFLGPVGEHQIKVNDRIATVWHAETLGDLHKGLLKLSESKPLRQLTPLINRIANTPVIYVSPGAMEAMYPGAQGFYDTEQKIIVLPDHGYLTPDEEAHRAMHEAVHAALHAVLDNDPAARKELMQIARALEKSGLLPEGKYGLGDAHEFLSEALSNPVVQNALTKLKMPSQQTGWRAFVAKVLDWLGWKGSPNALEAVMRVQKRLVAARDQMFDMPSELNKAYGGDLDKMLSDNENADRNRRLLAIMADRGTNSSDTLLGTAINAIDEKMQAQFGKGKGDAQHKIGNLGLWWSSFGHILQRWGRLFGDPDSKDNPIHAYGDAMRQRNAITFRLARLFGVAQDRLDELEKTKPHMKLKDKLMRLMTLATEFGLDPDKPFDDKVNPDGSVKEKGLKNTSERLRKLTDSKHPNDTERLKEFRKLHAEAVQLKTYLAQNAKTANGGNIYQEYRDLNSMLLNANQAVMLYNLVSKDPYFNKNTKYAPDRPSLAAVLKDPVESFLEQTGLHEDPSKAADFWKKEVDNRIEKLNRYLAHMKAQKGALTEKDWKAWEQSQSPLRVMLNDLERSLATMREAPYFHLGRHGNFMARFHVKLDPSVQPGEKDLDKRINNQKVMKQVADRLSKFVDVSISELNNNPVVMARFESKDERDRFIAEAKKLQAEGLVEEVAADMRSDFRSDNQQPAWLTHYINAIKTNSSLNDEQKQQMISIANTTWLDQLSDTAVSRVLAQRQYVSGFNANMLRNFAFRAEVGINSLANLSVSAKISDAFEGMENQHNQEKFKNSDKADQMFQVWQELRQRDADRPAVTGKDWIDTWRSINQAYFLGMSPAYTLVNMSQLGVMLLPELAKKHGFVKSMRAIAAVTPLALKIIKETWAEGRSVSMMRAMDAVITGNVLDRSGLDKDMHSFLTRMVNSGNIDLGSPMREMGRTAKAITNDPVDQGLRIASAMGYYSETFTRLIAAMSAHELEKGERSTPEKIDVYAARVLDDAMLNYSNWYTARATGKAGILGRFTPIPASFQQYTLQVMQKLYREVADAFGKRREDETDDKAYEARVKGARKFLIGHATVMSLLAGSLGLPFTTAAMALVDGLRSAFGDDDEPPDTKADYLNFLTYVFGKDMAEMVAHGLPRGLGFDVSGRTGEQDMAPLSRFFADRRGMEDKVKDLVFRSAGSPVSMLSGVAVGSSEFMKGNFMSGLQTLVPNSIKGVVKAGDMMVSGYHDANGTPLPITADPSDIIYQFLGLNPADKATYTEENLIRASRKTALAERATQLRNAAVSEMRNGGLTPETLSEIRQFDSGAHKMAVLPTLSSAFQRRTRQEITAKMFGLPLGADITDQGERERLAFGNLRR